jgi:zinc transporter
MTETTIDRLKPALAPDIPGCAWILRFDPDGRAEPGESSDLARIGQPGEGFVWLHLDLADMRAKALAQRLNILNAEARETLLGPIDHQFVEHVGADVSGAVLDHERGLSGRTSRTDYLRFAFGAGFLVSARRRPLLSAEETRVALAAGQMAPTPLALFEAIVERLCDEHAAIITELAGALDRIEEHVVYGNWRDERRRLGSTRRDALRLARQIGGLRAILQRLEHATLAPEHANLRDAAARLAQRTDALQHDVINLQDRARLLQDEVNAALNLETNDRLYLLTVVTTLLLPATFVTGYFGMNTKQLVFSEDDNGTIYATLLCVLASLGVYLFMRGKGLTRPNADDEPAPKRRGSDQAPRDSSGSF